MYTKTTTVKNVTGLHARPASEFVSATRRFNSRITVRKADSETDAVNARSIVKLMTLGLSQGTLIEISADGEDEVQAVDTLVTLVDSGFGEI